MEHQNPQRPHDKVLYRTRYVALFVLVNFFILLILFFKFLVVLSVAESAINARRVASLYGLSLNPKEPQAESPANPDDVDDKPEDDDEAGVEKHDVA